MTDTTHARETWPRWAHGLAVGTLLALGLAVRVYGAWAARFITDPDSSVVALMAKHMAAGKPLPVFFYGQEYMGTLEPAFSALLCRLFGTSGFMVGLGTALLGAAILPVVYLWGRAIGGRAAGLVALALCLLGPNAYLMFQWNPRGGYMATILLGVLVMWLGGRLANALWRRRPVPLWQYGVLGLLAGLGWWTNALVAAALAATALVLFVGARARLPWCGVAAGFVAFVLGGAPFWIWNIRHDWRSFAFLDRAGGGMDWHRGLNLLADHYVRMLNLPDWPPVWAAIAYSLPLALGACGLIVALVRLAPRGQGLNAHRAIAVLFLLLSASLYVTSSYARLNTARFLLPWVPAVAVLSGLVLAALRSRIGIGIGAALVLMIVASESHSLRALPGVSAAVPGQVAGVAQLAACFATNGIEAVYAHFTYYALNFNTGEGVPVTPMYQERYLPFAQTAESAQHLAVLGDGGNIGCFLAHSGGSAARDEVNGRGLHFQFQAPATGLTRLSPLSWADLRTSAGAATRASLTDDNADTIWEVSLDTPQEQWIEIAFASPTVLRGARLRAPKASQFPPRMRVEMLPANSGDWQVLVPSHPIVAYFWSGPRPYAGGLHFLHAYRFPDVAVRAIRFVAHPGVRSAPEIWALSELECFGPAEPPAAADAEALQRLLAHLDASSLTRVYGDRWLSNRLHAERPALAVMLDPDVYPECALRAEERIRLDPGTALVVSITEADTTRAVLARHGLVLAETPLAPWVLFEVPAGSAPVVPAGLRPPLLWAGYAALTGRVSDYACDLLALAESQLQAGGEPGPALRLVQTAVAADPLALLATPGLVEALVRALPPEHQDDMRALQQATPPMSHPLGIRYDRTIELLGINVAPAAPRAGQALALTYYWRMPANSCKWKWGAFVHFRQGDIRFQDDHHLPRLRAPESGTPGERLVVVREDRTVAVPANAPPGRYDLHIGLSAGPMQRARVDDYAPVKRRAAVVTNVFELQAAER